MPRPRFIEQGQKLWRGENVFQILDELWCLSDGRRYVALSGDTSSGKSTVINLLLGRRLLSAGKNQVTGCVTEIRPLPADEIAGQSPVVVTLDQTRLRERLDRLSELGDADAPRYEKAADQVSERLREQGLELGRTVPLPLWQRWDFSTDLTGLFYTVVAVERVILPAELGPRAAFPSAAAERISFIDVPGTAQQMHIVDVMREYVAELRPAVTIRVWDAARVDGPPANDPAEILIVNKIDDAEPKDAYQVADRSARAHRGELIAMSAAADAPEGFDTLLPSRESAQAALRRWESFLLSHPRPDADGDGDGDGGGGRANNEPNRDSRLLDALQRTLDHERGGLGLLAHAVQQRLDDSAGQPRAGSSNEIIRSLARKAVHCLEDLQASLSRPLNPEQARERQQAERDAKRQLRLKEMYDRSQREVYGSADLPVWSDLLGEPGSLGEAIERLRTHLREADHLTRTATGLDGEPSLDRMAAPLLDRFEQLQRVRVPGRAGGGQLTWVDVARMRWELTHLLSWTLAWEIENTPIEPGPGHDQSPVSPADYNMRRGVLKAAMDWTGLLLAR